jgi:hypothetical protein
MTIQVKTFEVWQDFMPSIDSQGAPLHAVISVEFSSLPSLAQTGKAGSVTLRRANGEQILVGDLELMRSEDDLGLKVLGTQQMAFRMPPQPVKLKLTEGEMIGGVLSIIVGGREMTAPLPETPLMFTH